MIEIRDRGVAFVLLAAGASVLVACTPKAGQKECEEMAEHIVKVLMRDMDEQSAKLAKPMMDEVRKKEIASCVGKSSQSEVKCVMQGKTGAEMQKCRSAE